jgi:16S rRNA (cytosine967-C5)-methyltransferase
MILEFRIHNSELPFSMSASPGRKTAYQILLRMESGRGFAVDLLQNPEVSALKEADRRLATELIMGVLRWRGELDFQIEQLSGKSVKGFDSEVLTILRMGAYQIRFLERVPKRAVVDDAVELTKAARKRSAAGLVNAVLRKCEAPKDRAAGADFENLAAGNRESVRRAFPEWLLKRWEGSTATTFESGKVEAMRLAHASLQTPRTTLRLNHAAPG